MGKIKEKGLTLVPLRLYFKGKHIKVEIALAKGRKIRGKRDVKRRKAVDKEVRKALENTGVDASFMKATIVLLLVPLFAFLAAAAILDPGRYLPSFSEADTTAYHAARSIASDWDLAYSSQDSDRYFKKYDQRPNRFRLL